MTDDIDARLQRSIRDRAQRDEAERRARADAERSKMDTEARDAERARLATEMWDSVVGVLPEIAQKITDQSGNSYKLTFSGRPNPTPFLRATTLHFRHVNAITGMDVFMSLRPDLQLECVSDAFDPFMRDMMRIERVAFTDLVLDLFDRFLNPRVG